MKRRGKCRWRVGWVLACVVVLWLGGAACRAAVYEIWPGPVFVCVLVLWFGAANCQAEVYEIRPGKGDGQEEFEQIANSLRPGDEFILHGGTYSQTGWRAVTDRGTA